MDTSQYYTFPPQQSQLALPPINYQQSLYNHPPPPSSDSGFPMVAIAVLGILATAFILISYYIFVTKCCFRWQQSDPMSRFLIRRPRVTNEDPLASYSPTWQTRGLNELLIREIPTFQYCKNEGESKSLSKCVVCLNEFKDLDVLRVLPKCSHGFHLDCIDVWLLSNSNCPLCRSSISGRNRYGVERITAPNSSPQEVGSIVGGDEDFVVIEVVSGEDGFESREIGDSSRFLVRPRSCSSRKFVKPKPRHVSIMGDEGLVNVDERDDQFFIQPIRRSFSMDSAVDRHVYLSIQEILRNEESSSRSRRPIFSFGTTGRGSRNAVLPIE
ncbi:hypothetical protein ACJIZ3_016844 [Penstemon smallii]|uniref:RING-type E3 ubiquitin transferase n=1 Tax=Penstemon smallii TaxID=265156 RepID=A0ABD3SU10_9LAMI